MVTPENVLMPPLPVRRPKIARLTVVTTVMILLLGTAGLVYRATSDNAAPSLNSPIQRAADGAVIIPSIAVNGVLEITIPPGTAESMAAGGRGYELPTRIDLHKGDKIIVHNNDTYPHIMMFAFVLPGQSAERTFTTVGSETYSAGCTIDPTPNGFTSLFVSE